MSGGNGVGSLGCSTLFNTMYGYGSRPRRPTGAVGTANPVVGVVVSDDVPVSYNRPLATPRPRNGRLPRSNLGESGRRSILEWSFSHRRRHLRVSVERHVQAVSSVETSSSTFLRMPAIECRCSVVVSRATPRCVLRKSAPRYTVAENSLCEVETITAILFWPSHVINFRSDHVASQRYNVHFRYIHVH